jgi:hypothetical protein
LNNSIQQVEKVGMVAEFFESFPGLSMVAQPLEPEHGNKLGEIKLGMIAFFFDKVIPILKFNALTYQVKRAFRRVIFRIVLKYPAQRAVADQGTCALKDISG